MYSVTIDVSENEALKDLLVNSTQTYVEYKSTGETIDEDRLIKIRKEVIAYLKKIVMTNVDAVVSYSTVDDLLDVGIVISLGLK